MLTAFEQIKEDYCYEDLKEIVNLGCQSGVCFKHIYYGDTVKFFETYPDEITEYIKDTLGVEVLSDTLKENDGSLTHWMNDLTWTFIELVAMLIVDEYESTTQEELSNSDLEYVMFGRTLNDNRYALA